MSTPPNSPTSRGMPIADQLGLSTEQMIAEAVTAGNFETLNKYVAESGHSLQTFRFCDGSSLLHVCAASAPSDLTKKLLFEYNFDVNTQSKSDGTTALHVAAATSRLGTVRLMLEAPGVDDTIHDELGRTAPDMAKMRTIIDAFTQAREKYIAEQHRLLIQHICQPNINELRRILGCARTQCLLNIDALDADGESLMHHAARQSSVTIIQTLLGHGADAYVKNRYGQLPVERATDEAVRETLIGAPMVDKSSVLGNKLTGYLLKYVNFANGYRRRFVVLDEGILSYYRSHEDYPSTCKGSFNVRFARLVQGTDRLCFELRTLKYSLFFKAENSADRHRWILSITHWQRVDRASFSAKIIDESSKIDPKTEPYANNTSFNEPNDANDSDEYFRALNESMAAIRRLDQALKSDVAPSAYVSTPDSSSDLNITNLKISNNENISNLPPRIIDNFKSFCGGGSTIPSGTLIPLESNSIHSDIEIIRKFLVIANKKFTDKLLSLKPAYYDADEEFYDVDTLDDESNKSKVSLEIIEEPLENLVAVDKYKEITPHKEYFVSRSIDTNLAFQFVKNMLEGYPEKHRIKLAVDSEAIPPLNIWSILKNAIGKDLTRIPIPVNFSEPTSMLQRLCEDLEYADLLWRANSEPNALIRIQFIAAFAISGYSSTDGRLSKPFNPILGETFEYVSRAHGYTYLSEQVSHHPPISACICECPAFKYCAEVSVKTKFWGKSLELVPEGWNHVFLKATNEHYSYRKVSTAVYNIILGKMWIDHYGILTVKNHGTGDICELELHPTGWRCVDPKKVDGSVFAGHSGKQPIYRITGHWNKRLESTHLKSNEKLELWRRNSLPPDSEKFYNFTYLTMALNEISSELKNILPPTDSRLRPDQAAMEKGHFSEANTLKIALEERQRAKRRMAAEGVRHTHQPRWFTSEIDPDTGDRFWTYMGGYWEARSLRTWNNVSTIYLDAPSPENIAESEPASPHSNEYIKTHNYPWPSTLCESAADSDSMRSLTISSLIQAETPSETATVSKDEETWHDL